MPANIIKSYADKTGKSEAELEKIWDDAKKAAEEQGQGDNYAYITSIFKNMAGVKEEQIFRCQLPKVKTFGLNGDIQRKS